MRVIILAAGEGTRLRPHTLRRSKCMVELAGFSLIARQIHTLRSVGVGDITAVSGYRKEGVESLGIPTRHNPHFATTNMVRTLMCAADLLDGTDDVLIVYADIVYEPRVAEALLACPAALSTTIDVAWRELWRMRLEDPLTDAETLCLDSDLNVLELGKKPKSIDEIEGQYMGLIKVRADSAEELVRFYHALDRELRYDGKDFDNMYMTSFLQSLIDSGHPLRAVPVRGGWLEVDSAADLERYEELHRQGELGQFCRLEPQPG